MNSKAIPNIIVDITVMGKRIFVGDVQESVFFVKYKVAFFFLDSRLDLTHF